MRRSDVETSGSEIKEGAEAMPKGFVARQRYHLKKIVSSMRWEMMMLAVVIAYFFVVFVTFAFDDHQVRAHPNPSHSAPLHRLCAPARASTRPPPLCRRSRG